MRIKNTFPKNFDNCSSFMLRGITKGGSNPWKTFSDSDKNFKRKKISSLEYIHSKMSNFFLCGAMFPCGRKCNSSANFRTAWLIRMLWIIDLASQKFSSQFYERSKQKILWYVVCMSFLQTELTIVNCYPPEKKIHGPKDLKDWILNDIRITSIFWA